MLTGNSNLLKFILSADGSELQREVEKSRRTVTGFVDQLSDAASGMNASMMMAVRGVQTLLGLQVVSWAKQSATALFEASAAAERLRIGLDFASARGSTDEIAYLRKTTDGLGLAFASTAQSYMQFQAAAKGTVLEGSKARDVFESVAKASAVMGLSAEQNSGVLLALQQMVSKGTVQAEELRGQLGERLPGAFQIAARSMGVTTAELGKMLEMGQVISDDFLPKFAFELERSLGGAAENAANRLDAAVNRFDNAWDRLKQKVGDAGVSKAMASEMNALGRDVVTVTETIERASAEGAGALSSLSQGALVAAGRAGFSALNLAANTLNGTINFLTGDLLGLNTNLAVLPDALKTNAEQAKVLAVDIEGAQAKLKRLQELDAMPSNGNYYKTAIQDTNAYIDKLREALKLRGALAVDAPNQPLRDKEAGNSRGNRTAYNNSLFASQQFLAERDDKVNKAFIADIEGLAKAYATGALSASNYAAAVNSANQSRFESTEAGKAESKALKDLERGAKGAQGKYQELSKSIEETIRQQHLEMEAGEKLTVAQKLRIKIEQEVSQTKRAGLLVDVAQLEANEAWLKNASEVDKALAAIQKAREQSLKTVRDSLQNMQDEEQAYAYAEASNISLAQAKAELAVQQASLNYQQAIERQEAHATLAYYGEQLRLAKEIALVTGKREVREANTKAAKDLVSEYDKASQIIGQTLQDYIMGGGKDAAEYLKRLFSTLVLQPVVKTAVGSVLGMGGSGESGSTGQAGSLLSGAQNISSIYSAFTGGITSTMAGGIASLGSAFGSSALTSFAAGMKGSTLAAGLAGPTTAGASGAMGLGATVGAALPWVAGGLAVVSLLGGLFGSNPKEHTGGVYSNATDDRGSVLDALNLTKHARGDFTSRKNEGVDTALATTIDGLLESYAGFAKRAAGDVRDLSVYAAFATNPISTDQDAYGYMRVIDKLTGDIVAQASRRDGDGLGNDPEKAYGLFTGEIAGVLVKELKAADLPGWMHSVFDSLGETVTLENYGAAVQQIALIDAGFLSLGKTMGMFADLSGQMQTSLLGVFGSIDNLTATASTFYNSYYSEAQRMETLAAQMQSALSGLNVQIDPRMGDIAKAQFKEAVEAAFAAGKGELGAQLLAMNQSFATAAEYAAKAAKDMQQAALAMAQSAVDGAFANFEAAVERERTYWDGIANAAQDAVGKLSSTLSLLTSNAQALYGTVDSTQQMLAAQGMVYIEDALAGVLGGASASSYGGLQDAINAARGGISNGAYATQFDRDRDTLVLAGQLSQLGELTDSQLSIEERALKAANEQIEQLDKTLEYWQQALDFDALNIDATLTVAQAVMALGPLITALQLERAGGSYAAAIKAVTPGGEGPKAALYQQMLGSGLTDAQIRAMVDKTTGVQTDSDWNYLKKLAGLPGFASGGMHTGGLRVVGERGWEIEATGPSRIWNQQQLAHAMGGGNGGNAELVAAIDRLTQQNEQLTARLLEIEGHTRKSAQVLVDVTNDGNAMVSEYL